MEPNRPRAATAPDPQLIPPALVAWLSVFRPYLTAPVWNRVLVLVAGAVLAPGKRTVTQALRVMGLAEERAVPPLSRGARPGTLGCSGGSATAVAARAGPAVAKRPGDHRTR